MSTACAFARDGAPRFSVNHTAGESETRRVRRLDEAQGEAEPEHRAEGKLQPDAAAGETEGGRGVGGGGG